MSPPTREKPAPSQGRPSLNNIAANHSNGPGRQLHARRGASLRLPMLESGCRDPWRYGPMTTSYEAAAAHLLECGLLPAPNMPALRAMWRRRGESQRAAYEICERWGLIRD